MAKKTAANKKSPKPAAAAKKPAAKKPAAKKQAAATTITEGDWAQIYAKAWLDDGFRTLLETDPTAALKQYAAEHGLSWTKLVNVPKPAGAPAPDAADENCIHLVSCC